LFDNYKNPKNSTQLIIPSIHLQKLKLYTAGGGGERERAGRRRRRERFEGK